MYVCMYVWDGDGDGDDYNICIHTYIVGMGPTCFLNNVKHTPIPNDVIMLTQWSIYSHIYLSLHKNVLKRHIEE